MNESLVLEYTVQAVMLILLLSLAPIVVAVVCGLLVSLIQALTQIQEQTLSFAIKLIAVTATLLLSMHWIGGELYNYATTIFQVFPALVR